MLTQKTTESESVKYMSSTDKMRDTVFLGRFQTLRIAQLEHVFYIL